MIKVGSRWISKVRPDVMVRVDAVDPSNASDVERVTYVDIDGYWGERRTTEEFLALYNPINERRSPVDLWIAEYQRKWTEEFNKPPPPRTCNRHEDCDKAERSYYETAPKNYYGGVIELYASFHCYSDDCEDCFGC